jgi:H+/Cl- antiporter ClcA
MKLNKLALEHLSTLKYAFRWTIIIFPVAVAIGSIVALFLTLLEGVTHLRFQYPWLLFLLPFAGIAIHLIYRSVGQSSERGNNLIMDEIHETGGGVPRQMAPVILVTTVVTHLFGGSAGREGTAVQIGGSIAGIFSSWFKLDEVDTKMLLTAGIAAGFGAVFGTPLTGAVFAMEVLAIGKIEYKALLPTLIASVFGDLTVSAWGLHHTAYHIDLIAKGTYFLSDYLPFSILLLAKVIFASVLFGLASYLFAQMVHGIKAFFTNLCKIQWLIPVVGGLIIIGLTCAIGKPDYLGLGIEAEVAGAVTIPSAFHAGGADTWSWLWKTVFTTLTLGTGFKGGEVTPLFYIGATLGVSLFAALGFIAVFAGATNTPLACTIMGVELFGSEYTLFFAVACFTAYLFSGHSGIYSAQRIAVPKVFNGTGADLNI